MYKEVIDKVLKNALSADKVLVFIPPYLGFSVMQPAYVYFHKKLKDEFDEVGVFCENDLETKMLADYMFSSCVDSISRSSDNLSVVMQNNAIESGFFIWHAGKIKRFLKDLTQSVVPAVKAGGCYCCIEKAGNVTIAILTREELKTKI